MHPTVDAAVLAVVEDPVIIFNTAYPGGDFGIPNLEDTLSSEFSETKRYGTASQRNLLCGCFYHLFSMLAGSS